MSADRAAAQSASRSLSNAVVSHIATVPPEAGRNGGETEPRSGNGHASGASGAGRRQETHEELCDRYAAMPELEWSKFRDDEAHRLRVSKSALDEMRKQGKRRQRDREKAKAQQERDLAGAEQCREERPRG